MKNVKQIGNENIQAKNSIKGQRKTIEETAPLTNGSGTSFKEFTLVTHLRKGTNLNKVQIMDLGIRAGFMDLTISAYQNADSTNQKADLQSLIYLVIIAAINSSKKCGKRTKNLKQGVYSRQNEN